MQIVEGIGEFGLGVTRGTGLASATGDLSSVEQVGNCQFNWRVVLYNAIN